MDITLLSMLVIALTLLFVLSLYLLGRFMAPPFDKKNIEKIQPYSCGEELPIEQIQIKIHQYYLAAVFTVLEVAALFLALTIYSPLAYLALIYLGLVFVTYLAYRSV